MKNKKRMIRNVLNEARRLISYDVGETVERLAQRLNKKPPEILKLNSNENFFIPLEFLRSILEEVVEEADPRIYPRDEIRDLKRKYGEYVGVSPRQIVIGTGSDQLIDLICRIFLRRGDEALAISPTFSIYKRCVEIQGAFYKPVPLRKDFSLDVESLMNASSSKTRIIFLCSPNNPTANRLERRGIIQLAERFEGLVAVDEAYIDFSEGSLIDLSEEFENLIIFRTFSKVFGLAGLRIGCAIANTELAKTIDEKFQMPYSVSLIAVKAALKILEYPEAIRSAIHNVKKERERLIRELNRVNGVKAFNSETNFVLFQVNRSSKSIYRKLLERGVIIRNIGRVLEYENCLRVTVAPAQMINRFLSILRETLNQNDG